MIHTQQSMIPKATVEQIKQFTEELKARTGGSPCIA
jgi:hypothetical protein